MGFLDKIGFTRLKEGLSKTRDNIVGKVAKLVATRSTIDDQLLEQVEEILIAGDVGVGTTTSILDSIKTRVKSEGYTNASDLNRLLKDEILRQCTGGSSNDENDPFKVPDVKPYVIMIVGINGVGKTTSIGKVAHQYVKAGKKVVIAAADTFRAAANEQLEIWAKRAGAEIIQHTPGSDPAAVAFDAVKSASARGADVVIIDTAGRLHTKVNLMEELKKIKRVVQKQDPCRARTRESARPHACGRNRRIR